MSKSLQIGLILIILAAFLGGCLGGIDMEITGIQDGEVYESAVTPEIVIAEEYQSLEILLNEEPYEQGTEIAEVGIYELVVKVVDMEGDTSTSTYNFGIHPESENLQLWLEPQGVETSSAVTKWNDYSPAGNHALASNEANEQPELKEDVINGRPVVSFDMFDYLNIDTLEGEMDNFSIVYLFRPVSPLSKTFRAQGGWNEFGWEISSNGAFVGIGWDESRITPEETGSIYQSDEWALMSFVYEEGEGKLYSNGELIVTKEMQSPEPWSGFSLGSEGRNNIVGDLAEIMIYDTALEVETRQDIEDYLSGKYDL